MSGRLGGYDYGGAPPTVVRNEIPVGRDIAVKSRTVFHTFFRSGLTLSAFAA
jgi:hypothetical protein